MHKPTHGAAAQQERDIMTKTTTKTTRYAVIDGTKAKPMGFVGYASTKDQAKALKAAKCRMGGYIVRERA